MSDPRHVVHYVAMFEERVDDRELLRRAAAGSREAVAEIARRYVGFVYAAALRQVRDAHLAEDVTQAVFVILAQKARRIKPGAPLHAWLFTTTRYAAANATKLRNRRQFHERQAAAMREQERQPSSGSSASQITPMLDEALAQLRESDRSAILLSYMAGKSWREVADALGTTEEAARKRVSRAVAQLRGFFAQRGVATTGAALVALITSASAEASVPPTLLGSVTAALAAGTASAGAAASTPSLIAKGAIHMMTWAHAKAAAAFGAVVVLTALGGAGAMVMRQAPPSSATRAAGPATTPTREAMSDEPGRFAATLDSGTTVELVAVARRDDGAGTWWNADGSPSDQKFNDTTSNDDPPHSHQVVLRIAGPETVGTRYVLPGSRGWSSGPAMQGSAELEGFQIVSFAAGDAAQVTTLRVEIAAGEWETLVSHGGGRSMNFGGDDRGNATIGPVTESEGQAAVTVSDTLTNHERRFVAIDQNGNEHAPVQRMSGTGGKVHLTSVTFPITVDEVAEVRFMARPFDQFVQFEHVSLAAGNKAEPKVTTGN